MKAAPLITYRTWVAAAGALAFLLCVVAGLVLWAGWQEVASAVARIDGWTLAVVLATSLACYGIRFLRWHGFTRALGYRVPWGANLRIFVAGLGLTWTPGKSGELLRGVFLGRYGVPFARTILLFYWDRLCDLAGMILLALVATLAIASGHLILIPAALAIMALLWLLRPGGALFSRAVASLRRRLPGQRLHWLDSLAKLSEVDARFTTALAVLGALAGAGAYAMQALGLLIIARALGIDLGFTQALLVTSVSTLAGAAILLPAGAGVVETTSAGLLVAQGLTFPDAVAVGLVHRAATFWFAIALGGGALASLAGGRKHA
jgi:uncharacterized protein (TIRG00374 family)